MTASFLSEYICLTKGKNTSECLYAVKIIILWFRKINAPCSVWEILVQLFFFKELKWKYAHQLPQTITFTSFGTWFFERRHCILYNSTDYPLLWSEKWYATGVVFRFTSLLTRIIFLQWLQVISLIFENRLLFIYYSTDKKY